VGTITWFNFPLFAFSLYLSNPRLQDLGKTLHDSVCTLPLVVPFFLSLTAPKLQAKCQKAAPNPSKDAELNTSLAGAQEAFTRFSDKSWLSWGAILLPHLVREVAEREKHAKEEEELAKVVQARAEQEERAKDRRVRLEAGMQKWMDDAISAEEWKGLEAEIMAEGLADGEVEEVMVNDTKMDIEAVVGDQEDERGFSIEDVLDDSPKCAPSLPLSDEKSLSPSLFTPAPRPKPSLRKKPVPSQQNDPPVLTKSEGKRKHENTPEIVDVDPLDRGSGRSRRTRPLEVMKATGIPCPDTKTSRISLRNVEGPVSKPSIPIILFANCLLSATVVPVTR
jgi:hypothetical protein